MGSIGCCGKAIFITLNILYLLFGLLSLGTGITLKVGFKSIENIQNDSGGGTATPLPITIGPIMNTLFGSVVNTAAIVFIILGIIISIIAILSMCSGWHENKSMLATYAAIILLILIAQVALVIVIATGTFNDRIRDEVREMIKEDFEGIKSDDLKSRIINFVQFSLQCCGVDSSADYDTAAKWEKTYNDSSGQTYNLTIPVSCCKADFPEIRPNDTECLEVPNATNSNKATGCFQQASIYITEKYRTYVIIGLSIYLSIQFLLFILAIYLAVMIGNSEKYHYSSRRRGSHAFYVGKV